MAATRKGAKRKVAQKGKKRNVDNEESQVKAIKSLFYYSALKSAQSKDFL